MIIDASVAFKWISNEEGSRAAFDLIGSETLQAPILVLAEICDALWKKAMRDEIDSDVSFSAELETVGRLIDFVDERPFIGRALDIARAIKHPIYDCIYVAVAEALDQSLVSADRKFLTKLRTTQWAAIIRPLGEES